MGGSQTCFGSTGPGHKFFFANYHFVLFTRTAREAAMSHTQPDLISFGVFFVDEMKFGESVCQARVQPMGFGGMFDGPGTCSLAIEHVLRHVLWSMARVLWVIKLALWPKNMFTSYGRITCSTVLEHFPWTTKLFVMAQWRGEGGGGFERRAPGEARGFGGLNAPQ